MTQTHLHSYILVLLPYKGSTGRNSRVLIHLPYNHPYKFTEKKYSTVDALSRSYHTGHSRSNDVHESPTRTRTINTGTNDQDLKILVCIPRSNQDLTKSSQHPTRSDQNQMGVNQDIVKTELHHDPNQVTRWTRDTRSVSTLAYTVGRMNHVYCRAYLFLYQILDPALSELKKKSIKSKKSTNSTMVIQLIILVRDSKFTYGYNGTFTNNTIVGVFSHHSTSSRFRGAEHATSAIKVSNNL